MTKVLISQKINEILDWINIIKSGKLNGKELPSKDCLFNLLKIISNLEYLTNFENYSLIGIYPNISFVTLEIQLDDETDVILNIFSSGKIEKQIYKNSNIVKKTFLSINDPIQKVINYD